jgi:pyruvate/2-oxoglutarate dehydrogenase complex dihydrolipoamide acyltransferase (E2) component
VIGAATVFSIDHRILDGLAAARFWQQVKGWLETVNEENGIVLTM